MQVTKCPEICNFLVLQAIFFHVIILLGPLQQSQKLSCPALHMLWFLLLTDRCVGMERRRKVGSQNNVQIVIYME